VGKVHWLALTSVSGVGGVTARRLVAQFGSVQAVLQGSAEELQQVPRVSADVAARIRALDIEAFEDELAALADAGVEVVTLDDDAYPANLYPLPDSPPLLYVSGNILPDDSLAVAIVGTREPTPAGRSIAEQLAQGLATRGLTVVSGLAVGIDTAAHIGALRSATGRTLAVPGSGLGNIHPRENRPLAQKIADRGAVLSELHPQTPATGPSLMARDRIVSGLGRAVIVVEAQTNSGSLDTAGRARSQGRLLYAVPGSPGARILISQGALALTSGNDDLDELAQQIKAHDVSGEPGEQMRLL
jgi:DNA processing protein